MTEYTTTRLYLDQLISSWLFNVSAVLGWFFILGLLFSIHDYETMFTSPMGQPVTQIIFDMIGKKGVIVLMESDVSGELGLDEEMKIAFGGRP
jgi:hypothetical protein